MFSVMIVDDEKAIRENLPGLINFEEFGFKVCGTAKNGADALSKLPQCCPDVVFLDVCMPVMDGLAFLKEIRKMKETDRPCIVMLSGYSDFEYARTAMRYGVKAYLTKPVDEDEAGQVLRELSDVLKERGQRTRKADVRELVRMFREVYHSGEGDREPFKGYRLMHCVILSGQEAQEEAFRKVRKLTEERLPGGEAAFCRSRGSVLSYLMEPGTLEDYQKNTMLFGRHLLHQMKKEGLECALLFDGTLFEKKEGTFRLDHDTHLYRMLTELFWGGDTIQLLETCPPVLEERRIEREEEYLEQIKKAIRERDGEKLNRVCREADEELAGRRLNIVFLQEISYRIYYGLRELLPEGGGAGKGLKPLDWRDAPCFIRYADWKNAIWEQISVVSCGRKDKAPMDQQGISGQVLSYVKENFREQITLRSVAEKFYISPSYLGKSFQKTTGMSLKQYVNELRMEEAKRLLRATDKMIYEIAGETGFTESKYFISRFTAKEGISPLEYRKKYRGE